MLKKVTIKNCLSFDDFKIELAPVNVLVGKNNSGKSNFCHALQFLRLTAEVENLVAAQNRAMGDGSVFLNFKSNKPIAEFGVHCELPDPQKKNRRLSYIYKLSVRQGKNARKESFLEVESESLKFIRPGQSPTVLISNRRGEAVLVRESSLGKGKKRRTIKEKINRSRTMIRELVDSEEHLLANHFKNYLLRIRHFNFENSFLRNPEKMFYMLDGSGGISYVVSPTLDGRGGNLSFVIYRLKEERKKYFDGFLKILNSVDGNIHSIDFSGEVIAQNQAIPVFSNGDGAKFYMDSLSDGTVRFMGLLAISCLAEWVADDYKFSPAYSVEEPENGIHTGLLKLLYQIYGRTRGQFLITAHSPYLIDLFDDNLVGVKVFDAENGMTVLRSIDEEKVKSLLEKMPLGEMHFRGVLGS